MKKAFSNSNLVLKETIQTIVEEEFVSQDLILLKESDVLARVFIEPFTDVLKTAKYGLEKNISNIFGNIRKVARQAAYAAMFWVASEEVTRVGKEENKKIEEKLNSLNSKYADVLKRNWDTLRTRDVAGLALMFNPALTIGAHVALKSPALALGLLEILSGGNPKVAALRQKAEELSKKVMPPGADSVSYGQDFANDDYGWGGGGGFDIGGYGESKQYKNKKPIFEAQPAPATAPNTAATGFTRQQLDQKVYDLIQKLLKQPDVLESLQNSPIVKALKTAGIDSAVDRAREISRLNTLDQFKKELGSGFEQFRQNSIERKLPKNMTPEKKKELDQDLAQELKGVYRDFYIKHIQEISRTTPGIEKEAQAAVAEINKLLTPKINQITKS